MPVYRITSPDGTVYRVTAPEGATEQEALAKVQETLKPAPEKPMDPTGSFGGNLLAGAGKALTDLGRGAKQAIDAPAQWLENKFGPVGQRMGFPTAQASAAQTQAEIDESRRLDAPLMSTGGGKVGNIAGNVAAAVPTMLIPGAGTYMGSALIGAGLGAAQPVSGDESRLTNTAIGAAGGAAGKFVGDKVGQAISSRLKGSQANLTTQAAQNAERDAILTEARKAGYVVPPSSVNPSATNTILEGASGKIKTAQAASQKNQAVTNDLARAAVGLKKEDPLTVESLEAIRSQAGKAYEAIKSYPQRFKADQQFAADIKALGNDFTAAAQEFPEIAGNPAVDALKTALSKPEMSPRAAVELVKKLRFDANKNFKAFDDPAKAALATAQKDAANAIEELIERNLPGTDLLKNFRGARELIAKTYSIEGAMQGSNVSAGNLASQLSKGKPLTGELKIAADFASQFPKAAQALKEAPGAVSALDVGLAFGTQNPLLLAARPAARAAILSKPYQGMAVNPNYTPNALLRGSDATLNNALVKRMLPVIGADAAIGQSQ